MTNPSTPPEQRNLPFAFGGGAIIGTLGGLIGLGGAEFRLPLLIGAFRFRALEAVILNKAMSLVVVATALPFRVSTVPFDQVAAHWPIIVNLLAGSLAGAWCGAGWATRLKSETLYKVIASRASRRSYDSGFPSWTVSDSLIFPDIGDRDGQITSYGAS
ncbi:TSUP family transporter, partial [Cypionkella sp. TWP1-2-1b2]|uniref:TSUP family transporter n=1 Tax=Cypionkella sp. TWP1-2-1b2 TaxID=2804675 RepID=UPI003CF718CC